MAVLDIRGTHGSGKSWVVHQLLHTYSNQEIIEGGKPIGIYLPKVDAAVVGLYNRTCGGCDGISTADEVVRRVRLFAKKYRWVILEGILVAHTFQRYSLLAKEIPNYTFAFLDTPMNVCVKRVRERRLAKGNTKPLNLKNICKDWHSIWERVRSGCKSSGHNILVLNWKDPLPQIIKTLEAGA
ncbi:hypothetical protein M0R72_07740 [Candidatus Pacearchaeota archaeon]|nr:hypothetical protein [Candidatus Pacearchaeota archaeon]